MSLARNDQNKADENNQSSKHERRMRSAANVFSISTLLSIVTLYMMSKYRPSYAHKRKLLEFLFEVFSPVILMFSSTISLISGEEYIQRGLKYDKWYLPSFFKNNQNRVEEARETATLKNDLSI